MNSTQITGRLWYLNSGFDLELSDQRTHHLHGAISQMTQWYIPVATPRDFVLVDLPPPAEFMDYLRKSNLGPARVVLGDAPRGLSGQAWGWSESAVKKLVTAGATVQHPGLAVVKEVNSRAFCHKLALDNDLGTPGAYIESDPSRLLADGPRFSGPIVVKTMHSNAGRGMLINRHGQWSSKHTSFVEKLSAEGQAVVVEPWLQRIGDISTIFNLNDSGKISGLAHYRTLIGPDGHCAGDFIEPGSKSLEPYSGELEKSIEVVSGALCFAGYFGPVGVDHFVYRHGRKMKLAVMVDINARHTLGTLALALHEKLDREKPLLLRLISRKKHRLPADYSDFRKLLGRLCWDRRRSKGVILLTSLRVKSGGAMVQPARSLFCIQAEDNATLKTMYSQLLMKIGNSLDTRLPFESMNTSGINDESTNRHMT